MRVLLVDDHAIVRAGIASLLRVYGMEVVGEASDGEEAIAEARRLRPDVVLMDVCMPRCDGVAATRMIKEEMPATKIVMLTVSDAESDLLAAIRSGAEGYLLKDIREPQFEEMLERLTRGESIVSPALAERLVLAYANPRPADDSGKLTKREREVLALVAQGRTNKEIGLHLYVSPSTVDFHIRNILAKLHLRNRSQAAVWAIEHSSLLHDDHPVAS